MSVMSLIAVSEVADRLGLSTRQVQHLVAQGRLRQLARGVIDEASVDRLLAVRSGGHRRAWSQATAWGAVALLSGAPVGWMDPRQRSRLRARLRVLDAAALVERARERASVTWYSGHPASVVRVRAELVVTSCAFPALGLAESSVVDGYLDSSALAGTVARHGLVRDDEGRWTLRATSMDLGVVADLAGRSPALAALDLASSLDVRERRAGREALDRLLEGFHG